MQWQPGYKLPSHPYVIEQILGIGRMDISYQARHLDISYFPQDCYG